MIIHKIIEYLFYLKTPKKRWILFAASILYWIIDLLCEILYYFLEMERGNDWGSPSLMLYTLWNGWSFILPFYTVFILFCLKGYKGKVSLFIWKKERPYWSIFWTLPFGYLIFESIRWVFIGIFTLHPEDVISNLFGLYIYTSLRAAIVTSDWFEKKNE